MRVLVLALCVLASGCAPLTLESFLYDPLAEPEEGYDLPTDVIPSYEDIMVGTADGESIHVVLVPSSGAHPEVTLLYFHGQKNNIGSSWPRIELLYPLGVNIAAVDPRGYGRSSGTPSEKGIHIDVQAVWDALADRPDLDEANFVIYGRSLGAAFATDLAAVRPPRAHITESAFESVRALVRDGIYVDLPVGSVVESRWDNLARIKTIEAPYLAMHGLEDDYVLYQYSQRLAAAHPGETSLVLVEDADHSDDNGPPRVLGQAAYLALLRDFLGL